MSSQALAHYTLLADLAASGVTDLVTGHVFDRTQEVDAPQVDVLAVAVAPKQAAAAPPAPTAPAKADDFTSLKALTGGKAATPRPQPQVAEAQAELKAFDPKAQMAFTVGEGPVLFVLTEGDHNGGALAWPQPKTPEGALLNRFFAALGLNTQSASTLVVREVKPNGDVYSAAELQALSNTFANLIKNTPCKVGFVFGQVGLSALVGAATPLASVRGEGVEAQGVQVYATYQPQALLEQPALKAAAWREGLSFKRMFSKL